MPTIGEIKRGSEIGYHDTPARKAKYSKFIWHACIDCGKERWVQNQKQKPVASRCRSCSASHTAKRRPPKPWRDSKLKDSYGYIVVRLPPDNFFYPMARPNGYVMEHRFVMAKHIKRCLLPWELVHHKNGARDDNRIENLELLSDKRFHIVDGRTKHLIRALQKRVTLLEAEIALLRSELENSNIKKGGDEDATYPEVSSNIERFWSRQPI